MTAGDLEALRTVLDRVGARTTFRPVVPVAPQTRVVAAVHSEVLWARPTAQSFVLRRSQRTGLVCFGIALACLWYLDALTTVWAVGHGAVEAGPFMRLVLERGPVMLLLAKGLGLALVLGLAWMQLAWGRERLAGWSAGFVGSVSLAIVLWNLLSILILAGVLA
jgi:hypothetical protein